MFFKIKLFLYVIGGEKYLKRNILCSVTSTISENLRMSNFFGDPSFKNQVLNWYPIPGLPENQKARTPKSPNTRNLQQKSEKSKQNLKFLKKIWVTGYPDFLAFGLFVSSFWVARVSNTRLPGNPV